MSANLTGVKVRDDLNSAEIAELVFTISDQLLKPGGDLVCKYFPGGESDQVFGRFKSNFQKLSRAKLKSTRSSSCEHYFVGKTYRGRE